MEKHKGLRLSVIGAVIFLISVALLLVLPDLLPAIGLLVGGALVWGGLIWTLFGYYASPSGPMSDS
jgi:hypothetical protein